jgi:hypothetical protein
MAIVVLATVFAGAIAGSLLAIWKCRVLCLLPAISFLVLIALLTGIIERASQATIALQIIAAIVAPQLSYLASFLFAGLIPSPPAITWYAPSPRSAAYRGTTACGRHGRRKKETV